MELMPDEYEVVEGLDDEKDSRSFRNDADRLFDARRENALRFCRSDPDAAHLPNAWTTGYDLSPTETLEAKKLLIPRAVEEDWICLFYHDADAPLCKLVEAEGKVKAVKIETN